MSCYKIVHPSPAMLTFHKILTTAALSLAASMLVSCQQMKSTRPEYGLGELSHRISPQKALAMKQKAEITIYRTDDGDVAYLVRNTIVCRHADDVAERFLDTKTPVTVHISYLISPSMIIRTVQPLLDAGLHQLNCITTVNNRTHVPFVYALAPIDKTSS